MPFLENSKLFLLEPVKVLIFPNKYVIIKPKGGAGVYNERVDSCGKRIAKAMVIRGMRQSELCRLAKIPKSSLSLYLSGAYEPKQDRVYSIAQALDVSEAWLMGYDVPMEKEKEISPSEAQLTEGERVLLELFNKVPEDKKDLVIEMIRAALRSL